MHQETLYDIVDRQKWQKVLEQFSEVLGLVLTTADCDGNRIAEVSTPPSMDEETRRVCIAMTMRWRDLYPALELSSIERKWKQGVRSVLGFYSFFIPLRSIDEPCAYIVVGPVVVGKLSRDDSYSSTVAKLGIDSHVFEKALKEIRSLTFYEAQSIIELIYDTASYLLQLEYQNKKLKTIAPEAPAVFEKVYGYYVQKLLEVLLDVSCEMTQAETGSLMLMDEKKPELYIKHARGLSPEIIEKGRVRLGEGIAGYVAQEKKPVLINQDMHNPSLRSRLYKPELTSSMSIPINVEKRILGVLNVATTQPAPNKFSEESVQGIEKLIQVIGITLQSLTRSTLQ